MRRLSKLCGLALSTSLAACGTSSNFNQIFGSDEDAADAKLEKAKSAYDRGDYDESEKLATELLDRNPDNEGAAVVLGYTYLSAGGIDPYQLARALIALDKSDKGTDASGGAKLQDDSSKASDASSTLTQLGTLINLTEADFETLSARVFSAEDNDGKEPTLFATASNKLFIPAKVNDELRGKVETLNYMNKAVKAICRFVDNEVKTDDTRHTDASCAQTEGKRNVPAKAHFLWAFSQLTEALVYQSVLLYSGAKNGTSNFQMASDGLNNAKFEGDNAFSDFVDQVSEIKNATDQVFDTASSDSMLRATLNDLNAVTLAFDAIAGLPEGIKNRIVSALKKINEVGETFGGGAENNAGALKGQMTEKFAKTVGGKVDKVVDEQFAKISKETGTTVASKDDLDKIPAEKLPAEKKESIEANIDKACASYDTLAKGLPAEKVAANKPKNCP